MRHRLGLAERQARVGIVANPAHIPLPVHPPREVLARWPDLRSPRRLRHYGITPRDRFDLDLSTHALDSFADEVRQKRSGMAGMLGFIKGLTQGTARS
jgi:hypothetical protein